MASDWKIGQIRVSVGALSPAQTASAKTTPSAPDPAEAAAWRAKGDACRLAGDLRGAFQAYARAIRAEVADPALRPAAEALAQERLSDANRILQDVLAVRRSDAEGLWLLGEVGLRIGRLDDAERLLRRSLQIEPGRRAARHSLAMALHWQDRPAEALAEAEALLEAEPEHPVLRHLQAASRLRTGDFAGAATAYEAVIDRHPDQALTWMGYAHVLKALGRRSETEAAYRRALGLRPGLGEAWWSLANLKTAEFSAEDVAQMEAALARPELSEDDRMHLLFALGKAREDAGRDAEAFAAYAEAGGLRRRRLPYDADETSRQFARARALFSPAFLAARAGQGADEEGPVFVVGLPRSGSTLVEQILASHSQVEGTQELPDLMSIAARLAGPARRASEGAYPDVLAAMAPAELAALGEEYLARTRVHRKLGRRFFVDKTPNNFEHLGLIRLILPKAHIVDVRRHPLACGFSAFKQHFAEGQAFSYDLGDIGRYYRDYVDLMAHFDAAAPGAVHRVIYERLVADPETVVRALLYHMGLEFEPACLRFYENDRAVRTASSEQVRRPIYAEGLEHWRRFEPWLDPLKSALGPALDSWTGQAPA